MPKRSRDEEELDAGEAPTEINPYQVLGLEASASQDEVKKAYRKAALKHHPDKASPEDKEAAHAKFQEVAFAFAILSDERRRKRYDTTGRTEESLDLDDDDFDWTTFFREQFRDVVTEEKINKFSDEYKGSDEERQAVLDAYTRTQGKMEKLYTIVMLSDMVDDEERFRAIIDEAVADGEVEDFKNYNGEKESVREKRLERARKRKEKEAKEADKASQEIEEEKSKKKGKKANGDAGGMGDLAALIQQRQQGRAESFFDRLENKYAPKGKKGKKAAPVDEPPEEAFAANRKNTGNGDAVEGARKSKRAKK
ncbi:hypothetical protein M409DRAFT_24188 [Zasmidium cellare ATCC 36951]|uniref:J domain-containing protein n=1 Tax=Zasmidium cellare ATCC 36951 TaxID=1080233 RepID=A0A6A6CI23_ZASCE|nr:uncharacterized protein M409DRAFT_24188 [Zasmidium cellare ATCC 36951]KAF2165339.1 hypothetical protein M409DRAFT_24188 [Zasmidium cellare ATCC 36951]